jgi:sulfite reductase (NADPH) flavoprotein alpha-component
MLTKEKLNLLRELIAGSTKEELIWLSGYLAGIVAQTSETAAASSPALTPEQAPDPTPRVPVKKLTIAYGTETGNAKKLATDFAAKAKKKGIHAKLVGLEQYRLPDLAKEEYFITVISTQGDGEPPAAARKFYDHIHHGGFRVDQLKYCVLALGDTAYPLFCQAGEDVDQQLQKIGGQRIVSLQKCDTDYEDEAGHWFDDLLQKLGTNSQAAVTVPPGPVRKHTGKKIFEGIVLRSINLNDRGSGKETYHLEMAAENIGYQPGDSIGITPENPVAVLEAILSLTGIDPSKTVTHLGVEMTVSHLLKKKLNIVYLPERVVKKYATIVRQEIPETKIGLLDLLKIYPVKDSTQFQEVIGILEPIAPRLYSISSSPEAHAGEIHITVAKDTFCVNKETKHGLCSEELSKLAPQQTLEYYISRNSQFKLPAPDKDIIMIGPGTGIAPFRSFLAERDATGAVGRNWLFFGDQHFTTDFLYQTEIQDWVRTGVLTRINTAFSRDQAQKIYVQHRMGQHGDALFEWLESGAYLYLCGAKEPMGQDVEKALLEIIQEQGKRNASQAESYLDELKEAGRYLKDVY